MLPALGPNVYSMLGHCCGSKLCTASVVLDPAGIGRVVSGGEGGCQTSRMLAQRRFRSSFGLAAFAILLCGGVLVAESTFREAYLGSAHLGRLICSAKSGSADEGHSDGGEKLMRIIEVSVARC